MNMTLTKKKISAMAALSVVAVAAYFYFSVISPIVPKPDTVKPVFLAGQNISSEHVQWIADEIGAYKLQPSAQIEVVVEGKKFAVTSKDGKAVAAEGAASDPDLRITADARAFARILSANNSNAEVVSLYGQKLLSVELLKDQTTLALKGYKPIYDALLAR